MNPSGSSQIFNHRISFYKQKHSSESESSEDEDGGNQRDSGSFEEHLSGHHKQSLKRYGYPSFHTPENLPV